MSFNFHVSGSGKVLAASHRGYCAKYPENTMPAFIGAVEAGTSCIELDVNVTKDGEVVVIHDPSINRTSTGTGFVRDLTYAELLEYDFGSYYSEAFTGTKIPLLKDVLVWAVDSGVGLIVEMKDREPSEHNINAIVNAFKAVPGSTEHALLLSFNHVNINKVKERLPELKLEVVTLARYADQLDAVTRSNAYSVCTEYHYYSPEDGRAYKKAGLTSRMFLHTAPEGMTSTELYDKTWGQNSKEEISSWLKEGLIDILCHDDVEYLKDFIKQAGLEPV
ncbi:glycerophosphodiester phosphodiesterase [Endozoicomonas ascidiicola]|uniref:glycerophosphodiester phosphodiesterase n=1 Tax=Endozoicomonas ascidiicola TaxID=1698521 RepID=UPI000829F292|nr:glycerophosphodiester phosphodiesterase family protein [Endozoicomonas ascidiicola]